MCNIFFTSNTDYYVIRVSMQSLFSSDSHVHGFIAFQKCQYCGSAITEMKFFTTTCVQCSNGKCTLSFHVTCAHAAGVVFETSDWPHPVYITCSRHMHLTKTKVNTFLYPLYTRV